MQQVQNHNECLASIIALLNFRIFILESQLVIWIIGK